MIRISVRGLAKFMTSSPSGQRRVLREFKYPDDDQPTAMRLYYKDATDRITAYHKGAQSRDWLLARADELAHLSRHTPGASGLRLKHNARALRAYEAHFGHRVLIPQLTARMTLDVEGVTVSVTPDLHASENGGTRLVKLDFSSAEPDLDVIKIVSQIMLEAGTAHIPGLTSSSVRYFDVGRGVDHRAARAGARTLREVQAACRNIRSLWPGI